METEKNRDYILANLDKYIIDGHGIFFHTELELENDYYLIGSEAVKDYWEVREKVIENILKDKKRWSKTFNKEINFGIIKIILSEKEDWELILSSGGFPKYLIRNRKDNTELDFHLWNGTQRWFLIGEMGYRGHDLWKDFDKERDWYLELIEEEIKKLNKPKNPVPNQNQQSTPSNPNQTPFSENNSPTSNQEPENQNNSPTNQDKQGQSTNKDNLTTPPVQENNPLPSPTDIQTNYNSDKDKQNIDNNPDLTNSEQKEQANELLKLIITAELLVKEKKFNSETLSKLKKEREQNNSICQILNKEGRVDKVIKDLESIEQSQKNNNNSGDKKQADKKIPNKIIWGGIFLIIAGLGIMFRLKKGKKWRKKRKKKI